MAKKQTVLRQINQLLQKQIEHLEELDKNGLLLPNELAHKRNQITSTQLLISKFIPMEREQIAESWYIAQNGYNFNSGEDYFTETYETE